MSITRRYKIHTMNPLLTYDELRSLCIILNYIKFEKCNFDLIDFIYANLFNLERKKTHTYPKYDCYFKNDIWIFDYNWSDNSVWINHDLIWNVLDSKFEMVNIQIRTLTKNILEDLYGFEKIKIDYVFSSIMDLSV